jgi:hypothetical protein
MAGAARKSKLTKYEVTIKREIEHTAVVEVEARSSEEAADMAVNIVDELKPSPWREGDVLSMSTKAKVSRG